MKVKKESEKVGLKLNIQKTKIMASGPITSWEIDGETVETVSDFIFWGSKITADGDCSHEIKRRLLLGQKVMTNLDSILKSRDITLPTKVRLVKAMVFPVVMYGCDSWTVKKAECRRIDAFELWCWRRLLGVLWTARRSNQSILKEISPGIFLEEMMLKLKLKYFEVLTHWKRLCRWEWLGAGGEGDGRGWDGWMASLTQWMWVWVNSGSWWWTGRPCLLWFMGLQRVRHNWVTELNWTEQKQNILRRGGKNTQKNYTRKYVHDPGNQDGVITHLKPDILKCKIKWALGSITMNKGSGGDRILVELFQILKDDGVKMLCSIWQKTWKT